MRPIPIIEPKAPQTPERHTGGILVPVRVHDRAEEWVVTEGGAEDLCHAWMVGEPGGTEGDTWVVGGGGHGWCLWLGRRFAK